MLPEIERMWAKHIEMETIVDSHIERMNSKLKEIEYKKKVEKYQRIEAFKEKRKEYLEQKNSKPVNDYDEYDEYEQFEKETNRCRKLRTSKDDKARAKSNADKFLKLKSKELLNEENIPMIKPYKELKRKNNVRKHEIRINKAREIKGKS
jgi:hypothetical protein